MHLYWLICKVQVSELALCLQPNRCIKKKKKKKHSWTYKTVNMFGFGSILAIYTHSFMALMSFLQSCWHEIASINYANC